MRFVREAIQYIVTNVCQWRLLPRDFPPFSAVRYDLYPFRDDGRFAVIKQLLRVACRAIPDREPGLRAAISDNQSVKTTESATVSGNGAGKKIKGCKRLTRIDTQGNLRAGLKNCEKYCRWPMNQNAIIFASYIQFVRHIQIQYNPRILTSGSPGLAFFTGNPDAPCQEY